MANKVYLSRNEPSRDNTPRMAAPKANTFPKSVSIPPSAQQPVPEQKKVNRRSSNKLIINWIHRKLVGTVKKSENPSHARVKPRVVTRLTSSNRHSQSSNGAKPHFRDGSPTSRRKTLSLHGEAEANEDPLDDDDFSYRPSSLAHESLWYPASAQEADDDASVRPLPPSIPPSPSPSRSSSSYLSHPHTFRSMAASTKPTTLLSIDLSGAGMAHIAQAPLTTQSHVGRFPSHPHVRHSSLTSGSISFSALSSTGTSRSNAVPLSGSNSSSQGQGSLLTVQAPLHTSHHPRNNPRPASPPMDNASMLTLASSAFGVPGRLGIAGYSSNASALGGGDSISHFDGSMAYPDAESTSLVLGDEDRLDERDVDASVRALRPRSSRRGSWDSVTSGWSAGMQQTPSIIPDKSLWTTNSVRTEGFSADDLATRQDDEEGSITQEEGTEVSPSSETSTSSTDNITADSHNSSALQSSSTDTVAHAKEVISSGPSDSN